MNCGKPGRGFVYSQSLILFLGGLKVIFGLGYREAEGLARGLSKLTRIPVPDYSTINRRIGQLDLALGHQPAQDESVILAVDATGMQVIHRKGWMRKKRKGFVKIHIAIDTKTKQVVSLEITDDQIHDSARFKDLIEGTGEISRISKVLADGSYDNEESFDYLAKHAIEAGILPRENAKDSGSGTRSQTVRACQKSRSKWKAQIDYGQRNLVESVFSSLKSMFGKRLFSHRWDQMVHEIRLKIHVYNLLVDISVPS